MEKGKEMVKAQADLPKKNAAPAEPAKSLEGTIQQVISKAVTSPTDAKIDFAQGLITLLVTHNKKVQVLLTQCNLLKL